MPPMVAARAPVYDARMLQGLDWDDHASSGSWDSWDDAVAQVHWPLGRVLTSEYAPALRALGLVDPPAQKLGRGGFGYAYRATVRGVDSVIKLTRDPLEVIASWLLRGKTTERIVPIHAVWSLPKMQQHDHWASWWVVHRSYLFPLGAKEQEMLELLFDFWKDEDIDLSIPKPGAAGRAMREKWRLYLREETDCSPTEINGALLLLDQISQGVREMGTIGIDWADILPDNLLKDKTGGLRIADVGFGTQRRDVDCDPPELTVAIANEYNGRP